MSVHVSVPNIAVGGLLKHTLLKPLDRQTNLEEHRNDKQQQLQKQWVHLIVVLGWQDNFSRLALDSPQQSRFFNLVYEDKVRFGVIAHTASWHCRSKREEERKSKALPLVTNLQIGTEKVSFWLE